MSLEPRDYVLNRVHFRLREHPKWQWPPNGTPAELRAAIVQQRIARAVNEAIGSQAWDVPVMPEAMNVSASTLYGRDAVELDALLVDQGRSGATGADRAGCR